MKSSAVRSSEPQSGYDHAVHARRVVPKSTRHIRKEMYSEWLQEYYDDLMFYPDFYEEELINSEFFLNDLKALYTEKD